MPVDAGLAGLLLHRVPVEGDGDVRPFAAAVGQHVVAVVEQEGERFDEGVGSAGRRAAGVFDPVDVGFRRGERVDHRLQGGDAEVVQPAVDAGQTGGGATGPDAELHLRPGRLVVRWGAVRVQRTFEVAGHSAEELRVGDHRVVDQGLLRLVDHRRRQVVGQAAQSAQRDPDVLRVDPPGGDCGGEHRPLRRNLRTRRSLLRQRGPRGREPRTGLGRADAERLPHQHRGRRHRAGRRDALLLQFVNHPDLRRPHPAGHRFQCAAEFEQFVGAQCPELPGEQRIDGSIHFLDEHHRLATRPEPRRPRHTKNAIPPHRQCPK